MIDPATNTFYWLLHSYGDGGLYSIDLNTYEITKITTFNNLERWGGAYIAQVEVDEGTPAAPADLTLDFTNGALNGKVTFTAPSVISDDDELTGMLNYVVTCDDEQVASGTVEAGATASSNVFTVTEGYHDISVVLSNDKGDGLPAKTTFWFGNDAPSNVLNVKAEAERYKVTLSWETPVQSLHGGYFDPEVVTYNVTRMPEGVVVAENLNETSFIDEIPSKKVAKYHYQIMPCYAGLEGRVAETAGLVIGDGVNLPYETNFSDEDCELMTVEDSNGDGNTWDIGDELAIYRFGDVDGDDWIFSAPFYFEAGTAYALTTQLENGWSDRVEKAEIKLGNAANSAAMTQTLLAPTQFESKYFDVEEYFSVEKTGTYYIGFHAMSPEDHFALRMASFKVEVRMSEEAPEAGKLEITPGEKGALSATLSITAPTKRFNGKDLDELEGVNIFHNGSLIDSMDEIEPGKTYSYVHEGAIQGINNYSLVFVNEEGNGKPVEAQAFIGNDMPLAPKNVVFKFEEDGSVVASWDSPGERGVNGGYVDPESLVYTPSYTHEGDWIILDETSETSVRTDYDRGGKQGWLIFGVIALNDMGVSDAGYSDSYIVGDHYDMPFKESLNNGVNKSLFSSTNVFAPKGGLGSDLELSASEIGGCLKYTPYTFLSDAPYIDNITTGVINTAGYQNVTLSFYYYNDASENNGDELTAALYDQDNDITYNLGSVKMDGSATEWRKFEQSKNIASNNLRIHIGITAQNGNTIYLDEFELTGINSAAQICGDKVMVTTDNQEINISGLTGENVTVASLSGLTLFNETAEGDIAIVVAPGIYVVKVADRTVKVIVK